MSIAAQLRRLAWTLLLTTTLSAQQASIEGMVLHSMSREPLPSVHVQLMSMEEDRLYYGAISDRDGRFSIFGLPAKTYTIMPERPGFVFVRINPRSHPVLSVALKPGERLTDYRLEMTPRAVIAGRVVDEAGDPVGSITVEAASVSNGYAGMHTETDDRGEFRLSGAPGKYHVKAHSADSSMPSFSPREVRTDGTTELFYSSTYYPDATAKDRAVVVEAMAGRDVNGIDIRLVRYRALTISGVVTGAPKGVTPLIFVEWSDSPQQARRGTSVPSREGGRFLFSRLQPGFYRLYARCSSGTTHFQSTAVDIVLNAADAANVELTLVPGRMLTGKLEFAGHTTNNIAELSRTVRLEPWGSDWSAPKPAAGTDKQGAFRLESVLPLRYRVVIDPMPSDAYVKSLQLDGATIAGDVLDLSTGAGGSSVTVSVGLDGGQVSGTVRDKDGQRAYSPTALVVLTQDPIKVRPDRFEPMPPDGKYKFGGIRPGKYRLFAYENLQVVGEEALKKLTASAEEIEIHAGDRIVKDLKLTVPEDASDKQ